MIDGNRKVARHNIGSPAQIRRILDLAVEKKIESCFQKWDFDDINKALPAFEEEVPRYRYVMVITDNGGKL